MCALLLGYGALHTLFYGVLYAPMFADLDFSVVGIGMSSLFSSLTIMLPMSSLHSY